MGFCALAGFACIRCASFKPFRPPAPVQQALAAIILAAQRRFRGAVLSRGQRPSSSQGASFRPSGLTFRRSRPPTAAADCRAVWGDAAAGDSTYAQAGCNVNEE